MKTDSIIKSTLILTMAGLITKVIGFIYRVYMAKELGAEIMGLYQLIMPLYILAWSISCSGLTTTISKLTSEYYSKKKYGDMKLFLYNALMISFFLSSGLSIILYIFAESLGAHFYNDMRVVEPLKVLTFSFPFMALGSSIRGYFYGIQKSLIPASSQVIEQVIKVLVIFVLISNLGSFTVIYAIIGVVISEFIGFLYVLYEYKKHGSHINSLSSSTLTYKKSFLILSSMALPLTLNKVLTSSLVAYENVLIPIKLVEYGYSKQYALETFGKLTGMALPLIYFPSSLLVAISISLVPALSSAKAKNSIKSIEDSVSKTLLFTSFSSFWALAFFIVFANHLSSLIFEENIIVYLQYLAIVAPLLYFQMVLNGILSGLGEHITLFVNNIIGSLITITAIYILIPKFGLIGFIIGLTLSLTYTSYMNYKKVNLYTKNRISIINLILKPFLSALFSILSTIYMINNLEIFYTTTILNFGIGIIILSSIYIFFIISTGFITFLDIKKVLLYIKKPLIHFNKNIFS